MKTRTGDHHRPPPDAPPQPVKRISHLQNLHTCGGRASAKAVTVHRVCRVYSWHQLCCFQICRILTTQKGDTMHPFSSALQWFFSVRWSKTLTVHHTNRCFFPPLVERPHFSVRPRHCPPSSQTHSTTSKVKRDVLNLQSVSAEFV